MDRLRAWWRGLELSRNDLRLLGIGALCLLLVAAGTGWVAHSWNLQTQQWQAELEKQRQELDKARRIAGRRESLERELALIEAAVRRFEAKLPAREEIPELLSKFRHDAEQTGVRFASIFPLPEQRASHHVRIPYRVEVLCTYPQLCNFLQRLEFGERFVRVDDLSIGPQKDGVSEVAFTISTYIYAGPTVSAAMSADTGGEAP